MVYTYTERSEHIGEWAKAMSQAQGAMKNAPRTRESHFGRYADLATIIDTIRPPLTKNGLCWSQEFFPSGDNTDVLVTELLHESGQWKRSILRLQRLENPQKYAAAVTYARRMALSAICGIAAEDDDDGETATQAVAVEKVANDTRAEQMLRKTIVAAKSPDEVEGILKRIASRVSEGSLSQEAADRLHEAATQRIARAGTRPAAS